MNLLAGYSRASRWIACPDPQPKSATSIPARSRSTSPVSGTIVSISEASLTAALSSAISSWNLGQSSYDNPPPVRNFSTILGATSPIKVR